LEDFLAFCECADEVVSPFLAEEEDDALVLDFASLLCLAPLELVLVASLPVLELPWWLEVGLEVGLVDDFEEERGAGVDEDDFFSLLSGFLATFRVIEAFFLSINGNMFEKK